MGNFLSGATARLILTGRARCAACFSKPDFRHVSRRAASLAKEAADAF